jgi:hypothetical protein
MPIPVVTTPAQNPVVQQNQVYTPAVANQLAAAVTTINQLATGVATLNAQSGAAVLAAGTVTVTGVTLTATSVITLSRKVQGGTSGAGGVMAPSASRNVAAGSFVINAVDTLGATVTTDTSTIDFLIIG